MKEKINFNSFSKVFWLFMFGNLLGVLVEGIWYLVLYNHWETHVVTIWGPFCLIYGLGLIILYLGGKLLIDKNILIKFLASALLMDSVELGCGLLLEFCLGMRAWNYSKKFLNFRGHICLEMTLIWGFIGVLFITFFIPFWDKLWAKYFDVSKSNLRKNLTNLVTIFMIINMAFTGVCIVRWSNRHKGIQNYNIVNNYLDKKYNDDFMQNRFIEWYFIK